MPSIFYDEVFSIPLAERQEKKRLDAAQEELEFSEYGRDPNIPPGWYLVPGAMVALLVGIFWLVI